MDTVYSSLEIQSRKESPLYAHSCTRYSTRIPSKVFHQATNYEESDHWSYYHRFRETVPPYLTPWAGKKRRDESERHRVVQEDPIRARAKLASWFRVEWCGGGSDVISNSDLVGRKLCPARCESALNILPLRRGPTQREREREDTHTWRNVRHGARTPRTPWEEIPSLPVSGTGTATPWLAPWRIRRSSGRNDIVRQI